MRRLPDWEQVLTAASHPQRIIPDAVLVGGTAVAIYAGHRRSADADHRLTDLRDHFDEVLDDLEAVAGWKTASVKQPVLILGSLDGIETGIRQLIRADPLRTKTVETVGGPIRLPTKLETLRIKAALILKRNATRDYIDFVALADTLGDHRTAAAMMSLDRLYPQPSGQSALKQLIIQLGNPTPYDRDETDIATYKGIAPRYGSWTKLENIAAEIANRLFDRLLEHRRADETDRNPQTS